MPQFLVLRVRQRQVGYAGAVVVDPLRGVLRSRSSSASDAFGPPGTTGGAELSSSGTSRGSARLWLLAPPYPDLPSPNPRAVQGRQPWTQAPNARERDAACRSPLQ